jgi:hypothetical protein
VKSASTRRTTALCCLRLQMAVSALFDAIPLRQSTRADYDGKPVSAADLQSLSSAAAIPGIDLILITDRPQIDRVRDLVVAANGKQMADAAFVRELKAWLRFSPREATQSGDGQRLKRHPGPPGLAWAARLRLGVQN